MERDYEDLAGKTPPVSKHPPMSLYDRAAQFAPFAALTGYERAIRETAERVAETPDRILEEVYDI